MTTAFVFAGGGSLGAIQVGALRELVRVGERPDFVVGASVGALNACFFAARPDGEGVEALEEIWRGLKRHHIFPLTWRSAMGWFRGAGSLFESTALRDLIERHLPVRNLEDATLPVHVVATNLSGATVCLSRGAAVDAVLASAAIPIAFPFVRIGEDHLMDGAIAGNTPILTAAELGATRIIVLQTGYACSIDGPPNGAVARGMHALTLLIANQMERDLQLLCGKVDVHVAPHLCPLDVSPFNFDQSAALIERASLQTRAWLDAGGLAHCTSPAELEHDHTSMMMMPPAAGGYDVVSYFTDGEAPAMGSPEYTAAHDGKMYLFATIANRDAFIAEPARFTPQYSGRCAFAMAHGSHVKGDPLIYNVESGRLFFNLDARIQAQWQRDVANNIRRADERWATARTKQEA
ncbi:MAG: patatin-like phospholipase family protein [Phycisphaerales bacterium]|nr:patatin-like phospholipase family protein [Hyphomonadaceae bacterium]